MAHHIQTVRKMQRKYTAVHEDGREAWRSLAPLFAPGRTTFKATSACSGSHLIKPNTFPKKVLQKVETAVLGISTYSRAQLLNQQDLLRFPIQILWGKATGKILNQADTFKVLPCSETNLQYRES